MVYLLAAATVMRLFSMVFLYMEDFRGRRLLAKECRQNVPSEAVIILPGVDWRDPFAWVKANFHLDDIKTVLEFARGKGKPVSFYAGPSFGEVKDIMADKTVKEVYFVGHGGTDFFRLGTEEVLCYGIFNDPEKYGKEFVHQVHCGTLYGKSLIRCVVPEENRKKCFFHPGKINSYFIEKEFSMLKGLI
jgi:hypothetical protein